MALRWKGTLKDRDVTDEALWLNRRALLGGAAGLGLMGIAGGARAAEGDLEPNSWEEITSYNNYYEFGTGKDDPARYAERLTIAPWTVRIDGLVDRPGDYAFEDILSKMTLEERLYRFRCVEAWSMVVPWTGFELADLLELAAPGQALPQARDLVPATLHQATRHEFEKRHPDVEHRFVDPGVEDQAGAQGQNADDASALEGTEHLGFELARCRWASQPRREIQQVQVVERIPLEENQHGLAIASGEQSCLETIPQAPLRISRGRRGRLPPQYFRPPQCGSR